MNATMKTVRKAAKVTAKATRTPAKKAPAKKAAARKSPAKKAPAKTKAAAPKTETVRPVNTWFIDGRPTGTVDRLSRVCFFFTKGSDPSNPSLGRLTASKLRKLLAKEGIDSPETTEFEFTLPNGKVLSNKVGVHVPIPPRVKGETSSDPKETAEQKTARATKKMSEIDRMKEAATRLRDAGRTGSGPGKVTVTKDNVDAILAATSDQLACWPSDPEPVATSKPKTKAEQVAADKAAEKAKPLARETVTPIPKSGTGKSSRQTAKAVA